MIREVQYIIIGLQKWQNKEPKYGWDPKEIKVVSVNRNTLSKQVVESIIQLLNSGQLKPGDKLPTEMEFMEKLNVSRPVLREALSSLESLGVITRKTREGTFLTIKLAVIPFDYAIPSTR